MELFQNLAWSAVWTCCLHWFNCCMPYGSRQYAFDSTGRSLGTNCTAYTHYCTTGLKHGLNVWHASSKLWHWSSSWTLLITNDQGRVRVSGSRATLVMMLLPKGLARWLVRSSIGPLLRVTSAWTTNPMKATCSTMASWVQHWLTAWEKSSHCFVYQILYNYLWFVQECCAMFCP